MVSKVKRGVLAGLSVGFAARVDDWSADRTRRTIRAARLYEVSLVHEPANPGATVTSVRADIDDLVEVRFAPVTWIESRRDFTDVPPSWKSDGTVRRATDIAALKLEFRQLQARTSTAASPATRERLPGPESGG